MLLFRQCCSLWHGLVFLFSAEVLKLKIENCNQFSIFVCRPKHSKLLTELPKREEEGSIRTVIFCPQCPLPRSPSLHAKFLPLPLPTLPRYTSLERRKREIRIYRAVTFPNINDFSAEYIQDLVITQRKTHSVVSLLLKERFPDKKGFSSRSVWRFFFKNGINLHNHLLNDELGQCTWDVQLQR